MARLLADESPDAVLGDCEAGDSSTQPEPWVEARQNLHDQRLAAVVAALKGSRASTVLDLGCGEGKLLRLLLQEGQFSQIIGMDLSQRALEIASERLHLDRMSPSQRQRLTLLHGSLLYHDARLKGCDAAALVEVIEHLEPDRLAACERVVFAQARPATVVLTTPNREFNGQWPNLPAGQMRHRDHRFEWTRGECRAWAEKVAKQHGYQARFLPVGPELPDIGAPSQMVIFTRLPESPSAPPTATAEAP
jgi:3' terminal RNA ribose 2'-O-methyltransferase Hen1